MSNDTSYWAVIELMGHVRIAGRVSEVDRYGSKVGRIDVPQADGTFITQFFGGSSLYRETAVTEEVARAVAGNGVSIPTWAWGLNRPALPASTVEPGEPDYHEAQTDEVPW
jgi:hypothetical protein